MQLLLDSKVGVRLIGMNGEQDGRIESIDIKTILFLINGYTFVHESPYHYSLSGRIFFVFLKFDYALGSGKKSVCACVL